MGRRAAAAFAGLALTVAGCGGGGDGPSDAGGSTSPSSSTSSPTETPETPEATPTVEPASGVEIELRGFRINAPKKWRITYTFVVAATAVGPIGDGEAGAMLFGVAPSSEQVSIAEAMRNSWKPGAKPRDFEEQPRTVVGGLSAFYYTADSGKFQIEHVMGMWDSGYIVEINIGFLNDVPAERQKEVVDSIVATYDSPSQRD